MITKARIAKADLWYERGEIVKSLSFQFDSKFFAAFEECFLEIEKRYKKVSRVILAGAYVEKPGSHKLGRAADLDGIEFEDGSRWDATGRDRLAAAIQGIFARKFGVVLGWTFDEAHEDHLHVDDTFDFGFRSNWKSVTGFVQWVLRLDGFNVEIDGVWGPLTQRAFWNSLGKLIREDDLPSNADYREFLDFKTQKFFSQTKKEYSVVPDESLGWGGGSFGIDITHGVDLRTEALEKIGEIVRIALTEGDLGA